VYVITQLLSLLLLLLYTKILPQDHSIIYTPLECVSIGNNGCLTSSIILRVPEDFAVMKLHRKALEKSLRIQG